MNHIFYRVMATCHKHAFYPTLKLLNSANVLHDAEQGKPAIHLSFIDPSHHHRPDETIAYEELIQTHTKR